LNIGIRDKGFEDEVLREEEIYEFIRCCSATTGGGKINPFNGIIINPDNTMAVAKTYRFLIGLCSDKFIPMHQV
jgi:hypothetical protein